MKTLATFSLLLVLFLPIHICAQITGVWTTESSVGFTARYSAASAVVNGKIYVMGGIYGNNIISTVQVFDPVNNSWSTPTTAGTFTPRYGFTCSVVDGKIYAMGGYADSCLNTLEVFDPSSNTWTTPTTTGTFTARAHLTSNVIGGKIYAIGGLQYDSNQKQIYLRTVEVFDPTTNIWTPVVPTSGQLTPRSSHVSEVVGGKIYLMGGFGATELEVFDPVTNSWTTPTPTGTGNFAANAGSAVIGNKIFVMGGYSVYDSNFVRVLDPSRNTWTTPQTSGRFSSREGFVAGVIGSSIYTMGGLSNAGTLNTNEVLNITSDAVASNQSSADAHLFPNPTSGILSINNIPDNLTKISIVNMLGETLLEINNPRGENVTIDLSKFPAGVYYARCISPESVMVKKIIRE